MTFPIRVSLLPLSLLVLLAGPGAIAAEPVDKGLVEGWQLWNNWDMPADEAKGCYIEKESDGTTLRYEVTMYAVNLYLGVAISDNIDGTVAVDGKSYTAHYTPTPGGDWAAITHIEGGFDDLLATTQELVLTLDGTSHAFDLGNMMGAARATKICVAENQ